MLLYSLSLHIFLILRRLIREGQLDDMDNYSESSETNENSVEILDNSEDEMSASRTDEVESDFSDSEDEVQVYVNCFPIKANNKLPLLTSIPHQNKICNSEDIQTEGTPILNFHDDEDVSVCPKFSFFNPVPDKSNSKIGSHKYFKFKYSSRTTPTGRRRQVKKCLSLNQTAGKTPRLSHIPANLSGKQPDIQCINDKAAPDGCSVIKRRSPSVGGCTNGTKEKELKQPNCLDIKTHRRIPISGPASSDVEKGKDMVQENDLMTSCAGTPKVLKIFKDMGNKETSEPVSVSTPYLEKDRQTRLKQAESSTRQKMNLRAQKRPFSDEESDDNLETVGKCSSPALFFDDLKKQHPGQKLIKKTIYQSASRRMSSEIEETNSSKFQSVHNRASKRLLIMKSSKLETGGRDESQQSSQHQNPGAAYQKRRLVDKDRECDLESTESGNYQVPRIMNRLPLPRNSKMAKPSSSPYPPAFMSTR